MHFISSYGVNAKHSTNVKKIGVIMIFFKEMNNFIQKIKTLFMLKKTISNKCFWNFHSSKDPEILKKSITVPQKY